MPDLRKQAHRQSQSIAYSGMAAALSVVLMMISGIIPVMTYVSPLICGILLLPIMLEFGKKNAWICWAVTTIIVMLVGPDKEAAFFYLFFGWYPMVKWKIDRIQKKAVCITIKIVLFTFLAIAMYAILAFLLHMDAVVAEFREMGMWMTIGFGAALVFCLMLFDRMLFPLCILYENRVRPRLFRRR